MNVIEQDRTLRLLLVEDNPGDEELVRSWLDEGAVCRFDISAVNTLESARASLSTTMFDAVILDLSLPDSQGVETISRLRAACNTVPILVLSGSATDELRLAAFRAGAQDFIGKNESPGLLLARGLLFTVERYCAIMQQHYLEKLVSANPDAVVVVDPDGIVRFANDAALVLFGRMREEFIGSALGLPVGGPVSTEVEIRRESDRRVAEMRVAKIDWVGQTAYLATLRDMTEYKRIEAQLRQSQKMDAIGRLAGGVAHDFNNLLTVVNGYVDVLLHDGGLSEEQKEMLHCVSEAGQRAKQLTSQLLAFGRKSVLNVESVDLNQVISDIAGLLRRLIGEDILLEYKLDPGGATVLADRTQLEQIVINLAVNARDAMDSGGRIDFETSRVVLDEGLVVRAEETSTLPPGDYICLSVMDTGAGMSEDTRSKIFEPFFTTKEAGKGTGLGLATVYGIVTQMNGHISCYSEPGLGTHFSIYLPIPHEEHGTRDPHADNQPEKLSGTETILLVEDDSGVRSLSKRVLESYGYTVLEADNGMTGLEVAREHRGPIQLLVTDVVMPIMGGRELGELIIEQHPETQLLYISGYTNDTVVRRGIATASVSFLQKPFSPLDLAAKVRAVLDAATGRSETS